MRKDNFSYLQDRLKTFENYLILLKRTENCDPSWFGFPITLHKSSPVGRVDLLSYLDQNKIGTRLLFADNRT